MIFHSDKTLRSDESLKSSYLKEFEIHAYWRWAHARWLKRTMMLRYSRAAQATAPFRSRDHQQVSHIYIYIYVCSAVGYSLCPLLFNVPFWRKILLSIPYLLDLPFCMKFYHWSISFLPVAEVENVPANIGPPDFDCQLNFREFHTTDTTCHNGLVYG